MQNVSLRFGSLIHPAGSHDPFGDAADLQARFRELQLRKTAEDARVKEETKDKPETTSTEPAFGRGGSLLA